VTYNHEPSGRYLGMAGRGGRGGFPTTRRSHGFIWNPCWHWALDVRTAIDRKFPTRREGVERRWSLPTAVTQEAEPENHPNCDLVLGKIYKYLVGM